MHNDDKSSGRRMMLRASVAALAAGLAGSAFADAMPERRGALPQRFAQEKLAQDAVQYQKMPKDGAKCSTCVNFVAPNACQIVAGDIDPNGWCIAYGPKSG